MAGVVYFAGTILTHTKTCCRGMFVIFRAQYAKIHLHAKLMTQQQSRQMVITLDASE